ncbi:MAG: hypothetical protein V4440_14595 [Pseudomonadota bacterium]
MAFEEGNQAAAKGRTVEKLIERINLQEDSKRLRKGLEALMDKVADGDQRALEFVTERLDGKARQAIDVGGQQDNPLVTEIIVKVIEANS